MVNGRPKWVGRDLWNTIVAVEIGVVPNSGGSVLPASDWAPVDPGDRLGDDLWISGFLKRTDLVAPAQTPPTKEAAP